jgi:hypothetical protein
MKALIKTLGCSLLLTASMSANADWSVSGGFTSFQDDIDSSESLSLGALHGGLGYTFDRGNFTFIPELRVGFGIGDDSAYGVDVEVDNLVIASLRGQYNVNDSFGIFVQPSYGRLEVSASGSGASFSNDDWETGIGTGASYKLGKNASIEAMYEQFDSADVFSFSFRYTF